MAQACTIFISYRREDSQDASGRIYDRLEARFGARQVLKDVDSFQPGADFRVEIDRLIGSCDVLLAVIGPHWAGEFGVPGQRRIDSPEDFVRIEVELALRREIPIIPLLLTGATMPSADSLPDSLGPLAYRNALRVRADPDFRRDMDRVIEGIEVNAREYRQRQRVSKPPSILSAPRAASPQAAPASGAVSPPLAEASPGELALPRRATPAVRPRGTLLRRNRTSMLAVASALLLIAFSASGLLAYLSAHSGSAQTNNHATATKTAQARGLAQTATAASTATATAFLQHGYATKTPGACDKGGGRWSQSPATFGAFITTVSCTPTSATFTGTQNPSFSSTSSYLFAAADFTGVGSGATSFPQNYDVSVHVAGLPADACIDVYTRAIKESFGQVDQGYEFDVCHSRATIVPFGARGGASAPGSWAGAFTMTAQTVGNHLVLLIDGRQVVALDDSTYSATLFLAIRVYHFSGTPVSATLSDFTFTPRP